MLLDGQDCFKERLRFVQMPVTHIVSIKILYAVSASCISSSSKYRIFCFSILLREGGWRPFQDPKAGGKAVRQHHRHVVTTSWFNVGKMSWAEAVLHIPCREGASCQDCRCGEGRWKTGILGRQQSAWICAKHSLEAERPYWFEALFQRVKGAALDTAGASSSRAPLHLPASSTASSCTGSLAEVQLLRKRRWNWIQDPAEKNLLSFSHPAEIQRWLIFLLSVIFC